MYSLLFWINKNICFHLFRLGLYIFISIYIERRMRHILSSKSRHIIRKYFICYLYIFHYSVLILIITIFQVCGEIFYQNIWRDGKKHGNKRPNRWILVKFRKWRISLKNIMRIIFWLNIIHRMCYFEDFGIILHSLNFFLKKVIEYEFCAQNYF